MSKKIKIVVVGCGNMGISHALAYHNLDQFEICGLVSRGEGNQKLNEKHFKEKYPLYNSYDEALESAHPDAVCISTYTDTHEEYAAKAFENGCHVFLEKPMAMTVEGANRLVELASQAGKKLVVGYILRHHPSWKKFVEIAHTMGKPLVMRMNLNQQSKGKEWDTHKNLMKSTAPIVDCGVHYLDMMLLMTESTPIKVSAIGARLSNEIASDMYNYGQLQVVFKDGSVGWYEAGWGPMMSETAFFVKDVVGPKGCVSIVANSANKEKQSDNIDAHTKTEQLKVHYADLDEKKQFKKKDEIIHLEDEPDHNALCKLEQEYFLNAMLNDIDLSSHLQGAVDSLKIVLAADKAIKTGEDVRLL